MSLIKELSVGVAGLGLQRPLTWLGATRGRGLVLCYHRIGLTEPWQVVPGLPVDCFRDHIIALRDIADIVPLAELESPSRRSRPAVAITFDDDYVSHLEVAVPVLERLSAPATFFLSGRDTLGLGPYWWQHLEGLIRDDGVGLVARRFGFDATRPAELAAAIAGTAACDDLDRGAASEHDLLDAAGIAELSARGFHIGFHTAHHHLLPSVDDVVLAQAMSLGRPELEQVARTRIDDIAYPHGQADSRVAASAADAFVRGWTGSGLAVGSRSPGLRRGRWEPGPIDGRRMRLEVALRLNRGLV